MKNELPRRAGDRLPRGTEVWTSVRSDYNRLNVHRDKATGAVKWIDGLVRTAEGYVLVYSQGHDRATGFDRYTHLSMSCAEREIHARLPRAYTERGLSRVARQWASEYARALDSTPTRRGS